MRTALIAIALALLSCQSANAECVFKNGRWVCNRPGILARATYRPQPRLVDRSAPTPAESLPCAACDAAPAPEYSAVESYEVTHAGPFCRNGRWYPGKAIVRGAKAVGRVWFPGKYTLKAVRGVRSKRGCCH